MGKNKQTKPNKQKPTNKHHKAKKTQTTTTEKKNTKLELEMDQTSDFTFEFLFSQISDIMQCLFWCENSFNQNAIESSKEESIMI